MTTTTAVPEVARRLGDDQDSTLKVTQWRVVVSEWVKLRSLRSSVITLLATFVVIVGFGLLFSAVSSGNVTPPDGGPSGGPPGGPTSGSDPTALSLGGVSPLAVLVIGVLGALLSAGEYSTGMIRSSLAAVPRRLPVLWGKAAVLAAAVLAVTLVAVFAAFAGGQAVIATLADGSGDGGASLGDAGVARALVGSALYLTAVGLLGLGLGVLLRATAGAIGALVATLLVVPVLAGLLPGDWGTTISRYLPSSAGSALMTVHQGTGDLSPLAGGAVLAAYVVVILGAAAVALRRRDA